MDTGRTMHRLLVLAALSVALGASVPAQAFGVGGAVEAATVAAVAGYGAQAATTATDDDDDDD